jgi:outer membrane receptor for ferrienterochelin and colicins
MKKIIFQLLILIAITTGNIYSQVNSKNVDGVVYGLTGKTKEPLEGAVVKWINTRIGTISEAGGKFQIENDKITDRRLIVTFVGYKTDTVNVGEKNFVEVKLQNIASTKTIVVEGQVSTSFISDEKVKTEVITQAELKKDACCDLSGCFGKNASVDVAVTDILTNTKELKVLGLEGSYTQILIDNMPMMSGLVTKFGVTSIPGTLINRINISKGSNSVIQGYESISGIMNVLLKDFFSSEKLLVNGYLNSAMEPQFNVNATAKLKKWNTFFAFQTVQDSKRVDDNGDGFLDVPLTRRYMFYNKWKNGSSEDSNKTNVIIGLKYLDERRIGGQKNFDYEQNLGSSTAYGQTVNLQNGDGYLRFSNLFNNESQVKVLLSGGFFNQQSYFGTTKYDGKQRNFNVNALYELPIYKKSYLRFGASYKYEDINEDIDFTVPTIYKTYAGNYDKLESVPGLYTEGSFEFKQLNLSLIGGLRVDFHNDYGTITTPRFLVRYQITANTVVRASIGTGFRTVNPFSEYPSFLGSGKNIAGVRNVKPEKTLNYGIDLLQYFVIGGAAGNINFDFYKTVFNNKVIAECDAMPYMYMFTNFSDAGSNVFQVESSVNFLQHLDFKLAYKFIDLYYFKNGVRLEQPFNSKHRVLAGLTYTYPGNSWIVNLTMQWFGKQKLPSTASYPVQYQRPDESDSYAMLNAQLTKNFKYIEAYVGIENLLNYTQSNPIIDANNPFSRFFDTSYVWGPTRGRDVYFGIRYIIK